MQIKPSTETGKLRWCLQFPVDLLHFHLKKI